MIEIVAYKNGWPLEFRQIAFALRQGLGPLALRIDHIGSTAVPGLAAKDVIDIQISVAAFRPELLSALSTLGYSRLEDFRSDHRPAQTGGAGANGKNGFSIRQPGNAGQTLMFACKDAPINAMLSCSVIICVRIPRQQNPMEN